jgi:excinuclease ABC subunit C
VFDLSAIIASLPHLPGVYRMLNRAGEVLYVGKALDLKKRIASYFQKSGAFSPRIQVMLEQVAAIETTVTRSEAEALLLENNLIKTLTPRYNILFRDDKSYPYLILTGHRYPRLAFHRGSLDPSLRAAFGPFPSAGAVRESIQLLQKVFRIRTCEDTVFANRSRPCLLHQIRRCTAPCVGLVSESDYAEDVNAAVLFLSGKEDEVIERFEAHMNAAAERREYEQAALFRDRIAALRKVRERQFVSGEAEDVDVVAYGCASGVACINLAMVRSGRHLGDKNFFPHNAEECGADQVIESFLLQHYLQHSAPPHIVVGARVKVAPLEELLAARAGHAVKIHVHPVGARRAWLEMAERNAQLAAAQQLDRRATQQARFAALREALDLPETAQRIECFDASHTMGEATVVACVVYDRHALQKGDYRRYNIASRAVSTAPGEPDAVHMPAAQRSGIAPGDDYGALREALTRRYRRIVSGEGRLPDLVLLDGGRGQLAVARETLAELGLGDIPLAAIAKGDQRRPSGEQLYLPGRAEPLVLGREHPALHLVQQIRDEAHRFAIEGHRARRGRARRTSPLERIAGIGAKRRQRLLTRFGGLRGVLAASVEELARVEGIGRALAEKIYQELH